MVREERGVAYGPTNDAQKYITIYIQPVHNFIIAWLYHNIWERTTHFIWNLIGSELQNKFVFRYLRYTIKQELHCRRLARKYSKPIKTTFFEMDSEDDPN